MSKLKSPKDTLEPLLPNYTADCVKSSKASVNCVKTVTRSRTISGVTYCDVETLQRALKKADLKQFYYIVHDRDIKEDGTPKEKHTHFVAIYGEAHSKDSILKQFKIAQEGVDTPQNTLAEYCKNVHSMLRYFTHIEYADKTQYPISDIKFHGTYAENKLREAYADIDSNYDWRVDALNRVLNDEDLHSVVTRYPAIVNSYYGFKALVKDIKEENALADQVHRLQHIIQRLICLVDRNTCRFVDTDVQEYKLLREMYGEKIFCEDGDLI